MNKTRVMIVDDQSVVRKGVAAILEGRPEWEVCGEASNGREAVAAAAKLAPDIVVMDISMPHMNGLDATRQILKEHPQTQILILSMHESDELVRDVLNSGARGYMLKSDAGQDLLRALESLRDHKLSFTSKVAETVLHGFLVGTAAAETQASPAGQLSPRQREIVQLLAEGKSNKEVAGVLNISVKTVETHRAQIMHKLGLNSISELVRYAIRNHII